MLRPDSAFLAADVMGNILDARTLLGGLRGLGEIKLPPRWSGSCPGNARLIQGSPPSLGLLTLSDKNQTEIIATNLGSLSYVQDQSAVFTQREYRL
jgi:hypothetical protein